MTDAARAAVERAEREPLLGHRIAPVRAAIDAAAALLDDAGPSALRARLMLRLAELQLAAADLEGAEQALEAAFRYAPDDTATRFVAAIRACRVALRRGPEPRADAERAVVAAAGKLAELDDGTPIWRDATIEIALAIAELALHDDPPGDRAAIDPLAALVRELEGDPARVDAVFAGNQLVAAHALSRGEPDVAARALRATVAIAKSAGSPIDEVLARLALASALVAMDASEPEHAEATHHVARARALAAERGLRELESATLLAEAGVLGAAGKTAPALDRVLELARAAAVAGDPTSYVAAVGIMAELYARAGDHASAFRAIAEAHRALETATGSDATPMFRPLLARLRDRVGERRLAEIADAVDRANRLADELAEQKTKDRN